MPQPNIMITDTDMTKLAKLIDLIRANRPAEVEQLEGELDRAEVIRGDRAPDEVIRMNSIVHLVDLDTGRKHVYQVVFPNKADLSRDRISVLAPIGTAMLGYSVGSQVEWAVPGGVRRFYIQEVKHEAEG